MPKRFGPRRPRRLARKAVRGRKSVGRRRQPVRQQSKGLPKRQQIQSSLGGLTMTRFVASHRPNAVARHIKKVGAPNYLNVTYPGVLLSKAGEQGYSSWYVNCGNDLRRIWASIQADFVSRNATNAEFVADAAGDIPNATFRYVLESATSMVYFANTSGTPVNCEVYDIVCKRDAPQIPLDFGANVMPNLGLTGNQGTLVLDPSNAWFQGMRNQSTKATGFELAARSEPVDPSNLGATPYQSKLFKDFFKVVRKTNVSLPIGGQHKHYVDLKPNAVIDNDMLTQNNTFKGLSFFTLIVASGVPVVACPDTTVTDPLRNPLGDANTSATSISIIQSIKYKWTWVEDSRENIYRANYINTLNSDWMTTQPAMTKVSNCEVPALTVTAEGVFVTQPSECTR